MVFNSLVCLPKKAILIDGTNLIYRNFFASLPPKEWDNSVFVTNHTIKAFLLTMFKLLTAKKYEYGLLAFDQKTPNWRKSKYSAYKTNRSKITSPYFWSQVAKITNEIAPLFGIKTFFAPNYEADDYIGSGVKVLAANKIHCEIYSSDHDFLQLISSFCTCFLLKSKGKMQEVNIDNCELLFGLKPNQIIDYKALFGDLSDNIKGVKGIGAKTALALLQKYGSLKKLYENTKTLTPKLQKILTEQKQQAYEFYKIAKIQTNLWTTWPVNKFALNPIAYAEIKKIITTYNFAWTSFQKYY